MTNTHMLRPGLTAIAAVLAFSSTPLMAQVATPTTTAPAPVAADSVPVTVTPITVAPAADPIAMSSDPIAAEPGVTATKARTKSVKRTTVTRTSAKAAPVAKASTTTRTERVTSATKPAAMAASVTAPVAMAPTQLPAPAPVPPVEPIASAPVAETTTAAISADETLPIVGAGLGALALAAAGLALGRRRRRHADEEAISDATYVEPAIAVPAPAEAAPQPRFAQTPAITPAVAAHRPADQGSARVEAAYAGPSEDNPSLSMKKRIKRAHALDQMERNGHVVPAPEPIRAAAAPRQPSLSTWAKPAANGLMFGRDPALKPAFQH